MYIRLLRSVELCICNLMLFTFGNTYKNNVSHLPRNPPNIGIWKWEFQDHYFFVTIFIASDVKLESQMDGSRARNHNNDHYQNHHQYYWFNSLGLLCLWQCFSQWLSAEAYFLSVKCSFWSRSIYGGAFFSSLVDTTASADWHVIIQCSRNSPLKYFCSNPKN